jgi:HD domain-containing protein
MQDTPKRVLSQPGISVVLSTLALGILGAGWTAIPITDSYIGGAATSLVALLLVAAIILTSQFPIHIRYYQKIDISSLVLYLIAVLLPPPLAATTAGLGVLTSELALRARRGTYLSDIVTLAARWVIIVLIGSLVAGLPVGGGPVHLAVLALAGGILWIGDILTLPFVLAPISGESYGQIVRAAIADSGPAEAAQYILGLLGALAAMQHIWALALLAVPGTLVYLAFKSAKEMHDGTRQLLESLADTVDLRDPYTGGHSRRVTELTIGILRELDMQGASSELIIAAARVHDIGKIGIPDRVLNKPGMLTAEERAIMETHPERGADLLRRYPDFAQGVEIVRHHHERWDGQGYPHRLKGTDIPLGARIVAVADSFDAMTSDRPYRPALPVRKAVEILRAGRGEQWDPVIVDAFLRSIRPQIEQAGPPHLRLVENTEDANEPAMVMVRA